MDAPIRWPDPDAPRSEVDTFVRTLESHEAVESAHEAPPVENGPSPMCNACGLVRVPMLSPFCKGCRAELEAGGVSVALAAAGVS